MGQHFEKVVYFTGARLGLFSRVNEIYSHVSTKNGANGNLIFVCFLTFLCPIEDLSI